jgi:hypothetical protein
MGNNRTSNRRAALKAASSLLAFVCAGTILLTAALAQERAGGNMGAPAEQSGFFGGIVRWFDQQASKIGSGFKDAGSQVEQLGHQAGAAAKTTATAAKNAADAMVRIPSARVVTGHEKCKVAPNGAPDCVAAANALCKAKGFATGKSADMTTTEVCSPQVYLSGRTSGAGCRTETYLSSALCQ